jgi:CxxC motif-containing protein (DUF1111 family)
MIECRRTFSRVVQCLVLLVGLSLTLRAAMQTNFSGDPGVRGGAPGAGAPLAGLTTKEGKFFNAGLDAFTQVQSVTGSISGTEAGLGPRFNLDSCGGCHAQPAIGGSSPAVNPQFALATKYGATNNVPSFITMAGPVREVRFKSDGGVHDLYTITGRTDAPGCKITQPDFISSPDNIVFRIPTPTFGAGLIQSIPDATILMNKDANKTEKAALGISGRENREGNAGTITRFGWKAQNKSLTIFSAEAYNVEQGVTNELFPQEREENQACIFNALPEDHTNYELTQPQQISSDAVNFATFMTFLAPPAPVTSYGTVSASSISNGRVLFASSAVGCAMCHTPSMTTGVTSSVSLSRQTANLFSDLLVHHMGTGLADGISQGLAGGDEFRTAPLWGLGQRIFFLHDGRTTDLFLAIQLHSSQYSEANGSIAAFNLLSPGDQQDILNFLRSL